jgi:hypothetical protein
MKSLTAPPAAPPGFDNHPALIEVHSRYRAFEEAADEWKELTRLRYKRGLDTATFQKISDLCREAQARMDQTGEAFDAAYRHWLPIKRELMRAEIQRALQFWKWWR